MLLAGGVAKIRVCALRQPGHRAGGLAQGQVTIRVQGFSARMFTLREPGHRFGSLAVALAQQLQVLEAEVEELVGRRRREDRAVAVAGAAERAGAAGCVGRGAAADEVVLQCA